MISNKTPLIIALLSSLALGACSNQAKQDEHKHADKPAAEHQHTDKVEGNENATDEAHADQDGEAHAEETQQASTLPEASMIDESMGMKETMQAMAKNFMLLKKADSLEAMAEPAKQLADYTSQAETLAINSGQEHSADMAAATHEMRQQISQLQAQISAGDEAGAKASIEIIDQQKNKGHAAFK